MAIEETKVVDKKVLLCFVCGKNKTLPIYVDAYICKECSVKPGVLDEFTSSTLQDKVARCSI